MKSIFKILFLTLISLSAFGQNADDIIKNHIKAIGGADKWNQLNSLYSEMNVDNGGFKIPIKSWQEHMKGMRIEFEVQGMTGIQVVTDKAGWSLMPFQGQTKAEPTNEEQLKSARSGLDLRGQLLDYKAKGSSVEYIGEDEDEGVEVYKLKLTDKEKTETTFFLDKSTSLILKSVTKAMFQGKEIESTNKYSNYKSVDGLLWPFSMDSQMGKMEFTKVEVNAKIDPAKYDMPK